MLDFEQSSLDELVQPAFLVTIICEAALRDSVVGLLKNLKVQGYTVAEVAGEGRFASFKASAGAESASTTSVIALQVEIRALVSKDLSQVILHTLKEPQKEFMIMAYRQAVEALARD
jgi:nitrogen regulatory protein PII